MDVPCPGIYVAYTYRLRGSRARRATAIDAGTRGRAYSKTSPSAAPRPPTGAGAATPAGQGRPPARGVFHKSTRYRVIAGRGFEWGIDSENILVSKGLSLIPL